MNEPDDRIDPFEEAAREAARITAAGTAAACQLTSRRLKAAVLRLAGRMAEVAALEAAGPPDAKWSWEMLKLPDAARLFHWEGEGAGGWAEGNCVDDFIRAERERERSGEAAAERRAAKTWGWGPLGGGARGVD